MPSPRIISGLRELADRYDALLCDVWGVIHNGRESFAPACEALVRYQQARGPVTLISNAPRPAQAVKPQLAQLGVPEAAWSDFVTSGDATVVELKARAPGPAWAVGPGRDAPLFEGTGVVFAEGPEDAAFIACTGLFDDEIETPEDYRERFRLAAARDLVMICANPDRVVHRGDALIYCAGALAGLYGELGGQVIMAGKPFAPIYGQAMQAIARRLGRPVDPARVLCIGDGLPTDVSGANNQGLDCLFVAGGIHAEEILMDGAVDPDRLHAFLTREKAQAAYAIPKLVW
jgi:HAD superfamily hydrolase (TIGR01459 family)